MTVPGLAAKVERVRAVAGARFDQIEFNSLTQVLKVTDDRQSAIDALKPDWQPDSHQWEDSPFLLVGSADTIADDIRSYRETLGFTYFVLRDSMIDEFAPIIAELSGT
jgi:alkanesulfonate monooxygenase SsuD/methylene tetrahydromethanopterin reductase-like flavin-dependent oxidoreductase (luciferase family)